MTNSNLALWESVEKTDPAQTKPITGKAYTGTSPKPYYIVKKATERFGPIGIGWGYSIVDEKLLDGALLPDGSRERIHMAKVRVWYKFDGARGEVEHVGQTQFCGRRKKPPHEPFTDEDAPKKSVTDALIKALSMIGFAGDIFMGRFDDSKYVSDLREELREEAARDAKAPSQARIPPKPPAVKMTDAESAKVSDRMADEILALRTPREVNEWALANSAIAERLLPDDYEMVKAKLDAKKDALRQSIGEHA